MDYPPARHFLGTVRPAVCHMRTGGERGGVPTQGLHVGRGHRRWRAGVWRRLHRHGLLQRLLAAAACSGREGGRRVRAAAGRHVPPEGPLSTGCRRGRLSAGMARRSSSTSWHLFHCSTLRVRARVGGEWQALLVRRPEHLRGNEGRWTQLHPRGTPPAPRFVHAAAIMEGELGVIEP
jgi:hypothetical protein